MRRRWRILIFLAVAGVATWLLWPTEKEPIYQGRTLSEWLERYDPNRGTWQGTDAEREDQSRQAAQAVRQIGTNALPFALEWISEKNLRPSGITEVVSRVLPDGGLADDVTRWEYRRPKYRRAVMSMEVFEILGPLASPAIPELTRRLSDTNSPYALDYVVAALRYTGRDGLPPLMAALANPRQQRRDVLLRGFRVMGSNAAPALPLITQCLDDTNSDVAKSAAYTLAKLALKGDHSEQGLSRLDPGMDRRVLRVATNLVSKPGPPPPFHPR